MMVNNGSLRWVTLLLLKGNAAKLAQNGAVYKSKLYIDQIG
jgi:hypothetical protein